MASGGELPPVCILAGGRGTRLGVRASGVPKPMVVVAGRPFLEHQLLLLAANGARRVVICVGFLGDVIVRRVGTGERFGLKIGYSDEGREPVGTGAAVRQALPLLDETFMVLYGDTYLDVDYRAVARRHRSAGRPATMTVLRNHDQLAPSNAVYRRGRVVHYSKAAPSPEAGWIDFGLLVFEREAFSTEAPGDLSALLSDLAAGDKLTGHPVETRFYEIGTPGALDETEAFLKGRSR